MNIVTATEAKQSFAALLEAAQRAPVSITKQSREVAVVMSAEEYKRLTRLNLEEFQQFRQKVGEEAKRRGLTPAKLKALLKDD